MVSKALGLGIVAVLGIGLILVATGVIGGGSTPQVDNIIPSSNQQEQTQQTGLVPTGTLVMGVTHVNSESLGTTFTDATNVEVKYWYAGTGSDEWFFESTSGSGTADIALDGVSTDVYGEVEIPAGQAYIVDPERTENDKANRVGVGERHDPDDDRYDDWMFPIDITNLNPTDTDITELSWKTFAWEDDGASFALNSPLDTDTDALGEGEADCDIDWRPTFSADAHAVLIGEAALTVNATDTDDYMESQSWLMLPHKDGDITIDLGDNTGSEDGYSWTIDKNIDNSNGNTIYTIEFGNGDDPADALLMVMPNNQGNLKVDTPVRIVTEFETNEALNITLGITPIDAQGDAYTEITDAVVCAEA